MSWQSPNSSKAAFQDAQLKFVGAVSNARETLTPDEWNVLLEIITILVARLNSERIWRERRS